MPKYLSKYDKLELITNKISERIDLLTKRVEYLDDRDDDRMTEDLNKKVSELSKLIKSFKDADFKTFTALNNRIDEIVLDRIDAIDRDMIIHTEEHHEHFKRDLKLKRRVEKLEGLKNNDKSDFIKTMKSLEESMTDAQRTHLLELRKTFQVYQEYIK